MNIKVKNKSNFKILSCRKICSISNIFQFILSVPMSQWLIGQCVDMHSGAHSDPSWIPASKSYANPFPLSAPHAFLSKLYALLSIKGENPEKVILKKESNIHNSCRIIMNVLKVIIVFVAAFWSKKYYDTRHSFKSILTIKVIF